MAKTTRPGTLWAVKMDRKMTRQAVEKAFADASKDAMKAGSAAAGFIERIDVTDKGTTVFVSGGKATAQGFSKSATKGTKKVKASVSKSSATALKRFR